MAVFPYITPKKMRRLDRLAREKYGISSLILMENAGRSAADVVLRTLKGKKKRVVCVCGRGNNGGDGFVCARHLINKSARVDVFLIRGPKELKGDARTNALILQKMGCRIHLFRGEKDAAALCMAFRDCSLVIDAIFGIGFSGAAKAPYDTVINFINQSDRYVLSLDVPSGLDALTGKAAGRCIHADATVTFGYPKTGFIKNNGPFYTGRVSVAGISLPFFTGQ